jgi:hypothetical protein
MYVVVIALVSFRLDICSGCTSGHLPSAGGRPVEFHWGVSTRTELPDAVALPRRSRPIPALTETCGNFGDFYPCHLGYDPSLLLVVRWFLDNWQI